MDHRRNLRTSSSENINKKYNGIDESLNKMQIKLKKEKVKGPKNDKIKITFYAIILIVATISTGLFVLPNFNPVGNTNFQTPQGQTLPLPSNMPSRYDNSLTQNPKLETAYQFAANHSEVLSQLICYCGCNNPMHQPYHENNDQCFWTTTGQVETHAENCSTCVYIALSAKTLYEANWSIGNIRAFIDAQYT